MRKELPVEPLGRRADTRHQICSWEARGLLPTWVPCGREGKGKSQKLGWRSGGMHLERQPNVEARLATKLSSGPVNRSDYLCNLALEGHNVAGT